MIACVMDGEWWQDRNIVGENGDGATVVAVVQQNAYRSVTCTCQRRLRVAVMEVVDLEHSVDRCWLTLIRHVVAEKFVLVETIVRVRARQIDCSCL